MSRPCSRRAFLSAALAAPVAPALAADVWKAWRTGNPDDALAISNALDVPVVHMLAGSYLRGDKAAAAFHAGQLTRDTFQLGLLARALTASARPLVRRSLACSRSTRNGATPPAANSRSSSPPPLSSTGWRPISRRPRRAQNNSRLSAGYYSRLTVNYCSPRAHFFSFRENVTDFSRKRHRYVTQSTREGPA